MGRRGWVAIPITSPVPTILTAFGRQAAPRQERQRGVRLAPGTHMHVVRTVAVQHARQHEQVVRQAVEVAQQRRRHRFLGRQPHQIALRPPDDRACHVCMRGACTAARQHEAGQLRQRGIHRRDLGLQPRYRDIGHAQSIAGFARHRQVGTDIEQIVLDACQHCIRFRHVARRQTQHADRSIRFIDPADRGDARRILAQPCAVAERGLTRIAATRHHNVDPHHRLCLTRG